MKKKPLFFFSLLFLLVCCSKQRMVKRLEPTEMPKLIVPEVKEVTFKNGMTCFLLEDHTLPLVTISAMTHVGSIYESPSKRGLARFVGRFMRSGGTRAFSPSQFDKKLDDSGIVMETEIHREKGEASLQVLSDHLEEGIHSFIEMLLRPRFDPNRLDIVKNNLLEDIRRERDDPATVAAKAIRKLIYGADNPWAREPVEEDIKKLTRNDAQTFHATFFRPQNIILAIAGDFSTEKVISMLEQWMQEVSSLPFTFPVVPETPLQFKARDLWIDKDLTQSYIHLGHLGVKRTNPDKYALLLMNYILGGAFKSRLVEEIRSQRGLVYYVSSGFSPETDYGLFEVRLATKSESTEEAIAAITSHIRRLHEGGGVSDLELAFAKKSLLNQQIFSFDSAFRVVEQRALFRFYGYPDDYWKEFRDSLQSVTKEDILRVSQTYLHPDELVRVVVGKKND